MLVPQTTYHTKTQALRPCHQAWVHLILHDTLTSSKRSGTTVVSGTTLTVSPHLGPVDVLWVFLAPGRVKGQTGPYTEKEE